MSNKIIKDPESNYYVNLDHSAYDTYVSDQATDTITWNETKETEIGETIMEDSDFVEDDYTAILENVNMYFILQKRDELLLDGLSILYKVKKNDDSDYDLLVLTTDISDE